MTLNVEALRKRGFAYVVRRFGGGYGRLSKQKLEKELYVHPRLFSHHIFVHGILKIEEKPRFDLPKRLNACKCPNIKNPSRMKTCICDGGIVVKTERRKSQYIHFPTSKSHGCHRVTVSNYIAKDSNMI